MSVLVVGYRKSLAEFLHMVFGTWSGETDADFIPISFPSCTFFESTTRPPFLPNASWKIAMKCPDPWEMMWEDRRHCDASKKKGRKKSLGDLLLEDWKTIYLQIYIYIYLCVLVMHLCPHGLKHKSWESQPITKAWEHPWTNSIPPDRANGSNSRPFYIQKAGICLEVSVKKRPGWW